MRFLKDDNPIKYEKMEIQHKMKYACGFSYCLEESTFWGSKTIDSIFWNIHYLTVYGREAYYNLKKGLYNTNG